MKKMIVAFSRDYTIASFAIRLFTWSRWHHCGVVTKDGQYVIEAKFFKGVVKTPIEEFKKSYRTVKFGKPPVKHKNWEQIAKSKIGNKYDRMAIISIIFRLNRQHSFKNTCSEVTAEIMGTFRKDKAYRVTPEDIWMICEDVTDL